MFQKLFWPFTDWIPKLFLWSQNFAKFLAFRHEFQKLFSFTTIFSHSRSGNFWKQNTNIIICTLNDHDQISRSYFLFIILYFDQNISLFFTNNKKQLEFLFILFGAIGGTFWPCFYAEFCLLDCNIMHY